MGKGGKKTVVGLAPDEVMHPGQLQKAYAERWVAIDDVEYNVTNFKHPGGSVINYYLANTNADATEAYREFHFRSSVADKYLKSLPSRPAKIKRKDRNDYKMLENFKKFRADLVARGFFDTSPAHVVRRIGEVAAMFVAGYFLISQGWTLSAILVLGVAGAHCGWIQHEGGHNSLTGKMWLDKRIQSAFIGFGLGSSPTTWNNMHQKHHSTPQKINHDVDLDTLPFVAFFKTAAEASRRPGSIRSWWIRYQAYTFLPVTSGGFVMAFWLLVLHPMKSYAKGNWEALSWMASSHIVNTAIIMHLGNFGFLAAYGIFWAAKWISGAYLFGHFALSHTHCDVVNSNEHRNWVEYATHHAVDIDPSKGWINWVMGYLNCQVIHHLFPSMPQYRQPEVSKLWTTFCKENGLRYEITSYSDSWARMLGNLDTVGKYYAAKIDKEGKISRHTLLKGNMVVDKTA